MSQLAFIHNAPPDPGSPVSVVFTCALQKAFPVPVKLSFPVPKLQSADIVHESAMSISQFVFNPAHVHVSAAPVVV